MSGSKSYEPRHEAEVVVWQDLTEDQRAAVEGAHGLFSRMAEIADDIDKRGGSRGSELDIFLPHIDEKRRNHVVLIDGERGTGKTAVMLRLLVDWSAAVRGHLRERIENTEHDASPVTSQSAIVPVGLLDLQALSPKAMLGLHLAGHLQRVVEAMERRTPKSTKSAPWAPGESEDLKSRKAWQTFLRAAAAAWDGNLKERQGKIDPEAYVIELEQAERERLEIGGTFRAFVDALVDDYHERIAPTKKNPFFVVTIDDADMNPQRTMEIFELIRVLWHPRVGFLIAGDGDLFVAVLEEDLKKQQLASGQAAALARDMYRKAIPPMQRYKTGAKPAERYMKIANVLAEIPTRSSALSVTLDMRDYFLHDEDLKNALPRRIRDLLDLESEIRREKPSPLRFTWRLWQEALGRTELPRELRDRELVLFKEEEGKESLQFSHELQWSAEPMQSISFDVRENVCATIHRWMRFQFSDGTVALPSVVSDACRAALETATLESQNRQETLVINAMTRMVPVVRVEVKDGIADWWAPSWGSFRSHFLFFQAWKRLAANAVSLDLDLLAKRYVELCINLIKQKLVQKNDRIEIALADDVPTWSVLAAEVVGMRRERASSTPRDANAAYWSEFQPWMLAAPEYGLSPAAANEWLQELRDAFGADWKSHADALREYRAGNKQLNVAAINQRFPEFDWSDVVEKRATGGALPRHEDLVERLMGILGSIPTDRRIQSGAMRSSLMEYVTYHRRSMLDQAKPKQLLAIAKLTRQIPRDKNGTAQMALWRLWNAANEPDSKATTYLQWDKNQSKLLIHSDLRFEIASKWAAGNSSGVHIRETLARGMRCSLQSLETHWHQDVQKHLTSVTDFLLRIAWDAQVDANDDQLHRSEMPVNSTLWRGAAFLSERQKVVIFWPGPDWPLLHQWENAVDEWNRELLETQKMLVPEDQNIMQQVVDGLAFTYIDTLQRYTQGRPSFSTQMIEPSQWFTLAKHLPYRSLVTDDGTVLTSTKDEAYNDWWHRVVVMAAPELGLSPQAAAGFLDGLFDEEANRNRHIRDKADAPRLRREHAIQCGVPENAVDLLLSAIDAANPDHPWVKRFSNTSS